MYLISQLQWLAECMWIFCWEVLACCVVPLATVSSAGFHQATDLLLNRRIRLLGRLAAVWQEQCSFKRRTLRILTAWSLFLACKWESDPPGSGNCLFNFFDFMCDFFFYLWRSSILRRQTSLQLLRRTGPLWRNCFSVLRVSSLFSSGLTS